MNIENTQLGVSAIMGNIYIYVPDKNDPENMKEKKEVTEQFKAIAGSLGYVKSEELSDYKDLAGWIQRKLIQWLEEYRTLTTEHYDPDEAPEEVPTHYWWTGMDEAELEKRVQKVLTKYKVKS